MFGICSVEFGAPVVCEGYVPSLCKLLDPFDRPLASQADEFFYANVFHVRYPRFQLQKVSDFRTPKVHEVRKWAQGFWIKLIVRGVVLRVIVRRVRAKDIVLPVLRPREVFGAVFSTAVPRQLVCRVGAHVVRVREVSKGDPGVSEQRWCRKSVRVNEGHGTPNERRKAIAEVHVPVKEEVMGCVCVGQRVPGQEQ